MPEKLNGKDYCKYRGWYHTDFTLPSEYFQPDVTRPALIREHTLDFTYLFDSSLDNPDYRLLGKGRQIRSDGSNAAESVEKRKRGIPNEIDTDALPLLRKALRRT